MATNSIRSDALEPTAADLKHASWGTRLTRLLLDAGADPNDRSDGDGPESLYHACEHADKTCLRLLLRAKPRRGRRLPAPSPAPARCCRYVRRRPCGAARRRRTGSRRSTRW